MEKSKDGYKRVCTAYFLDALVPFALVGLLGLYLYTMCKLFCKELNKQDTEYFKNELKRVWYKVKS